MQGYVGLRVQVRAGVWWSAGAARHLLSLRSVTVCVRPGVCVSVGGCSQKPAAWVGEGASRWCLWRGAGVCRTTVEALACSRNLGAAAHLPLPFALCCAVLCTPRVWQLPPQLQGCTHALLWSWGPAAAGAAAGGGGAATDTRPLLVEGGCVQAAVCRVQAMPLLHALCCLSVTSVWSAVPCLSACASGPTLALGGAGASQ